MNGRLKSSGVIRGRVILRGGSGDGKSAYDLAVQEGFEGTLEDWLASLHVEDLDAELDGQGEAVEALENYVDELANTSATYRELPDGTPNRDKISSHTDVINSTKDKLVGFVEDLPNNPMFKPKLVPLVISPPTELGERRYIAGEGVYKNYDGFSSVVAESPSEELTITENTDGKINVLNVAKLTVNVPTYIKVSSEEELLSTEAPDGTIAIIEG